MFLEDEDIRCILRASRIQRGIFCYCEKGDGDTMKRKYTNRRYLDALQERIIVFDGAMGTSLQKQNLGPLNSSAERNMRAATITW